MIRKDKKPCEVIETERFLLRELLPDDVTDRYCDWMNDSVVKKWITGAQNTQTIESLREYVLQRVDRCDVYFFGIFERTKRLHIGNIKYEPVLPDLGVATMGVLIGDSNFRGVGAFDEVFTATAGWLNKNYGIKKINLGVHLENRAAVRSYYKAGFEIQYLTAKNEAMMAFSL